MSLIKFFTKKSFCIVFIMPEHLTCCIFSKSAFAKIDYRDSNWKRTSIWKRIFNVTLNIGQQYGNEQNKHAV